MLQGVGSSSFFSESCKLSKDDCDGCCEDEVVDLQDGQTGPESHLRESNGIET